MRPLLRERMTSTPVGPLYLIADDEALAGAFWPGRPRPVASIESGAHPILDQAERELTEYFAGWRQNFDVRCHAAGTAFQQRVWQALTKIPIGQTRSYSELAAQVGRPRAVRAVGAANALNPLSIFVPCHRVIGANGSMTGYAGGIEAKRWLLQHEARTDDLATARGQAATAFDSSIR